MTRKIRLLVFCGVAIAAALTGMLIAQVSTVTPNLGLQIPSYQQTNWQVPITFDLNLLDTILAGTQILNTGATPTVTQAANWTTSNTGATTITNFVGGLPGQRITVACGASDTFTSIPGSANILVRGAFSCATPGSISFVLIGTVWTEISRSGGNGVQTVQVNGTNTTSQTTINFQNSAVTNGLTLTFSNPSLGNIQSGFTGTLTDAGLTSAYSGVGACPTGPQQFVISLARNVAPTCAVIPGGTVYNTTASASNAGISTQTMVASVPANGNYLFNYNVAVTTTAVGCSVQPTAFLVLNYTNPLSNINQAYNVPSVQIGSATWSVTITFPNGGNPEWVGTIPFRAKSGTAITYGVNYTAGTGCSTNPSYAVAPNLTQQ